MRRQIHNPVSPNVFCKKEVDTLSCKGDPTKIPLRYDVRNFVQSPLCDIRNRQGLLSEEVPKNQQRSEELLETFVVIDRQGAPVRSGSIRPINKLSLDFEDLEEEDVNSEDSNEWNPGLYYMLQAISIVESIESEQSCPINLFPNPLRVHETIRSGDRMLGSTMAGWIILYMFSTGERFARRIQYAGPSIVTLAKQGDLNKMKDAYESGAEISAGWQTVRIAVQNGRVDMLNWLFDSGVDINDASKFGVMAAIATHEGHLGVLQWLKEKDDELHVGGQFGLNAAHIAVRNSSLDILKSLHLFGYDLSQKSNSGCSVVHYAAQEGNVVILKWLASIGLDLSIADKNGKTPEDMATEAGLDLGLFFREMAQERFIHILEDKILSQASELYHKNEEINRLWATVKEQKSLLDQDGIGTSILQDKLKQSESKVSELRNRLFQKSKDLRSQITCEKEENRKLKENLEEWRRRLAARDADVEKKNAEIHKIQCELLERNRDLLKMPNLEDQVSILEAQVMILRDELAQSEQFNWAKPQMLSKTPARMMRDDLLDYRKDLEKLEEEALQLQTRIRAKKTDVFDALNSKYQQQLDKELCSICYEEKTNRLTYCGHQFCSTCIGRIPREKGCPICRKRMHPLRKIF